MFPIPRKRQRRCRERVRPFPWGGGIWQGKDEKLPFQWILAAAAVFSGWLRAADGGQHHNRGDFYAVAPGFGSSFDYFPDLFRVEGARKVA